MMARCIRCGRRAVVRLRYARASFCREHFLEYVENRVLKTVERFRMFREGDRILVAVSGGKDSLTLLHAVSKLEWVDVLPTFIDLGISGYSEECLRTCEEACENLGLELNVYDLKSKHGFTVDDLARLEPKLGRPVCSSCGLVKRYVLNEAALELGATCLATGHTLDDESAYTLHNILTGGLDQLLRGGPVLEGRHPKLVRKVKPLYEVSSFETGEYCRLSGITPVSFTCPYRVEKVLELKEMLGHVEDVRPGTRLGFMRFYLKKLKPALLEVYGQEAGEVGSCRVCGFPTSRDVCSFCRLKERVLELLRET